MWCLESDHKENLISKDVIFNEAKFPFKKGTKAEEHEAGSKVSFKVKPMEQQLRHCNNEPVEENVTEGTPPKCGEGSILNVYRLSRDMEKRSHKPTVRYGFEDLAAFALNG